MQIIATIRKGYTLTVDNARYSVLGSHLLRGRQWYILQDANGIKRSICREHVLSGQRDGSVAITAK